MPGDAPSLRTLNPRTGPPIAAFAEARPGVICVLLLATPAAGLTGNLLLLETSRALAGARFAMQTFHFHLGIHLH